MDLISLARLARSRFPGAYEDKTDEELGSAYAKKFGIPVDPPKKETGFVAGAKNLLGGINETINPAQRLSDVLEGPAYALRHPIDSASMMLDAARQGSQDQFEKMYNAPTALEGLGHAVAGAVPFIGPAAGMAGERIGQFGVDNQEGMRGIGNAIGLLGGGKLVEKGVGTAARLMPRSVTEGAPRASVGTSLDPADMPQVPMMGYEKGGSGAMAKIAKALESSIPGSGPFSRLRAAQQNALIDELGAQTTARMAQPGANLRPYDIGEVLKEALTNATADSKTNAIRADNTFSKLVGNDPIRIAPIQEVAYNRLKDIAETPNLPTPNSEVGWLKLQTESKPGFTAVRRMKKAVYEGKSPLHPDYKDPMYTAAAESLNNAAQERGVLPQFENLNKTWSDHFKTFEEGTIPKMRDKLPPEEVHKQIVGASLDDIAAIKKAAGPEGFRDVKARILQDVMEEAMSGELDTSPKTLGQSVKDLDVRGINDNVTQMLGNSQPGRRLSGKKMRSILENKNRFGEERLRNIFDNPKEYEAVMHFTDTAEKVGASPSSLVGAFINAGLLTNVMQAGKSAIYGDMAGAAGNLGEAAVMYGGVNLASRMMTGELNPTRLMSRVISRPGGAKAMASYISALAKKNADLPESIRFKVPSKATTGKAYFWGRIVGKMAQDEADKMEAQQ